MTGHQTEKVTLLNRQIEEAKSGLLYSGLSCVGFLVLGGIITGVTYSMAEPGGTYVATTGLFLVGAISGVVAIWRLVQLLFYLARRGAVQQPAITHNRHTSENEKRDWGDLE